MQHIQFGWALPIFANPGMLFFRTPNLDSLSWPQLKENVRLAEELGYDSLFVADHLFLGHRGAIFEGWTTLCALAGLTEKMSLIPIHLCNAFRSPSLMAKAIATLAHISDNRFTLFYDYGWRRAEFDAYGFDFGENDQARISAMDEGLTIIKGMLQASPFTFQGRYYSVREAINLPLPTQRVPIWMGEAQHPDMVDSIVRHADVFNSMPCSLNEFQKKKETVLNAFHQSGRPPDSLGFSFETQILVRNTHQEIDETLTQMVAKRANNASHDGDILAQLKSVSPSGTDFSDPDQLREQMMIGTPSELIHRFNQFIDAGVTHFMLWFMDYPSVQSMTIFAEDIRPRLKKI